MVVFTVNLIPFILTDHSFTWGEILEISRVISFLMKYTEKDLDYGNEHGDE